MALLEPGASASVPRQRADRAIGGDGFRRFGEAALAGLRRVPLGGDEMRKDGLALGY